MCSHVSGPVGIPRKLFITKITLERLLSGMHPHVDDQFILVPAHLPAASAFGDKPLLARA